MALWSTSCRGERNGVGKGGERGREQSGERKETATGTETDRERRKGRQAGARRTTGNGSEKSSVGGERGGAPGDLRGKGCQLDFVLTISVTGTRGDWSQHFG